jgi:hypothetical protein
VDEETTGPVVTGELVGVDNLTDRERALVAQHAQFRDLLARFTVLWRETARRCRAMGGLPNIAAGVAYDIAAGDLEDALTTDAADGTDHG